ncbi:hypothetical protein ATN91_08775 [Companilactobacillus kimchii]|nr:hypothetical protein ATN91_12420 [Companilactobacillus kimchii]KAE9560886.1 hypothetical protein ATN91_08775 [Companilactobacillus kimchii]
MSIFNNSDSYPTILSIIAFSLVLLKQLRSKPFDVVLLLFVNKKPSSIKMVIIFARRKYILFLANLTD